MKKLYLKDVRKQLQFHVNYGLGDLSIRQLIKDQARYTIDWDVYLPTKKVNLQRGFIWTLDQKRELIYSIFKGIEIPPLTLISYEHKVYRVIDSKQRLSTIMSFCNDEFSIIWNGEEYYFRDLDWDIQNEFLSHGKFKINVGYEYFDAPISDDNKIAWFEMINFTGTPQDIEHLKILKDGNKILEV